MVRGMFEWQLEDAGIVAAPPGTKQAEKQPNKKVP